MTSDHRVAGAGWEAATVTRRAALAPDDVLAALTELGIHHQLSGTEVVLECPYHEDLLGRPDRKLGSFKMNAETGMNRCYSCGGRGSFARYVATVQGWSSSEGQNWVVQRGASVVQRTRKRAERERTATGYGSVSEAKLVLFDDPPAEELERRRCTAEAAAHYRVRWDADRSAWILPIRDPAGIIMGWQVKTPRIVRNHPARTASTPGVELDAVLFGWAERDRDQPLLVVESPLDVVRLRSVDLNAVATYGATVTDDQQRLLMTHEVLIVLCLDWDSAGAQSTLGLLEGHDGANARTAGPMLGRTIGPLRVADLGPYPKAKDPGDLDDEDCPRLLTEAIHPRHAAGVLGSLLDAGTVR